MEPSVGKNVEQPIAVPPSACTVDNIEALKYRKRPLFGFFNRLVLRFAGASRKEKVIRAVFIKESNQIINAFNKSLSLPDQKKLHFKISPSLASKTNRSELLISHFSLYQQLVQKSQEEGSPLNHEAFRNCLASLNECSEDNRNLAIALWNLIEQAPKKGFEKTPEDKKAFLERFALHLENFVFIPNPEKPEESQLARQLETFGYAESLRIFKENFAGHDAICQALDAFQAMNGNQSHYLAPGDYQPSLSFLDLLAKAANGMPEEGREVFLRGMTASSFVDQEPLEGLKQLAVDYKGFLDLLVKEKEQLADLPGVFEKVLFKNLQEEALDKPIERALGELRSISDMKTRFKEAYIEKFLAPLLQNPQDFSDEEWNSLLSNMQKLPDQGEQLDQLNGLSMRFEKTDLFLPELKRALIARKGEGLDGIAMEISKNLLTDYSNSLLAPFKESLKALLPPAIAQEAIFYLAEHLPSIESIEQLDELFKTWQQGADDLIAICHRSDSNPIKQPDELVKRFLSGSKDTFLDREFLLSYFKGAQTASAIDQRIALLPRLENMEQEILKIAVNPSPKNLGALQRAFLKEMHPIYLLSRLENNVKMREALFKGYIKVASDLEGVISPPAVAKALFSLIQQEGLETAIQEANSQTWLGKRNHFLALTREEAVASLPQSQLNDPQEMAFIQSVLDSVLKDVVLWAHKDMTANTQFLTYVKTVAERYTKEDALQAIKGACQRESCQVSDLVLFPAWHFVLNMEKFTSSTPAWPDQNLPSIGVRTKFKEGSQSQLLEDSKPLTRAFNTFLAQAFPLQGKEPSLEPAVNELAQVVLQSPALAPYLQQTNSMGLLLPTMFKITAGAASPLKDLFHEVQGAVVNDLAALEALEQNPAEKIHVSAFYKGWFEPISSSLKEIEPQQLDALIQGLEKMEKMRWAGNGLLKVLNLPFIKQIKEAISPTFKKQAFALVKKQIEVVATKRAEMLQLDYLATDNMLGQIRKYEQADPKNRSQEVAFQKMELEKNLKAISQKIQQQQDLKVTLLKAVEPLLTVNMAILPQLLQKHNLKNYIEILKEVQNLQRITPQTPDQVEAMERRLNIAGLKLMKQVMEDAGQYQPAFIEALQSMGQAL
ncbi:MAG: hypothetical protein K0S07_1053 [Chlamydiales bacterium]|nr:hypothetical protein [Chlamydiales bacterium]